MIEDQGEIAITLKYHRKGGFECESYTLPGNGQFEQEELRNLYLLQSLRDEKSIDEKDRPALVSYLEKYFSEADQKLGGSQTVESMMNVIYDHEDKAAPRANKEDPVETRETFVTKKYKLVAQKIRPVYQDLLDKFRIIRDIKGDPLDMLPKLNRNPPDFVPTGRYTEERKAQFATLYTPPPVLVDSWFIPGPFLSPGGLLVHS